MEIFSICMHFLCDTPSEIQRSISGNQFVANGIFRGIHDIPHIISAFPLRGKARKVKCKWHAWKKHKGVECGKEWVT